MNRCGLLGCNEVGTAVGTLPPSRPSLFSPPTKVMKEPIEPMPPDVYRNDEETTSIGPNSKVSLVLLGGIFSLLLVTSWQASQWATTVNLTLDKIQLNMASLSVKMNQIETAAATDRWTKTEMKRYLARFKELNPDVRVPTIE